MSTPEQRRLMAASIVDFEARRDSKGRIHVYKLPPGDGGGKFEVAGINDRYHPEACGQLISLIEAGQHSKAEVLAAEYIASFTDAVVTWTKVPAVECYLRDTCFNRGQTGAARIFQIALGVLEDGLVGAATRAAADLAAVNPHGLLNRLREARETYERRKRDESSKFWKGLVNRWNKALEFSKRFLPDPQAEGLSSPAAAWVEPETVEISATGPVAAAPPAAAMPAVIPALRLGSRGAMVAAWQSFLHGQGLAPGVIDGDFGRLTEKATAEFQKKSELVPDGVAGRQTLLAASQKGFSLIEEPADDHTGSDWPPRPGFPPLTGNNARAAVFGRFDYVSAPTSKNPEAIRILGDWEAKNIVTVPIPQLRLALGPNSPYKTIRFHKLAADQLKGLWSAWEKEKLLKHVLSYEGGFVARFIRGSRTTLSNHAFGSAFDINAKWNGLGIRPALKGDKGSVRELVQIAHDWGFYWGGHFASRVDGMHFEIAVLK